MAAFGPALNRRAPPAPGPHEPFHDEWEVTCPLGKLSNFIRNNAGIGNPNLRGIALPAIQDRVQMMHTLTVDVGHLLFIHLTRHATAFLMAAQNAGAAAGLPIGDLNIAGLPLLNSDFATDEVHLMWAYKLCGRRNGFVQGNNALDLTYLSLRRSYNIYLRPTMYPTYVWPVGVATPNPPLPGENPSYTRIVLPNLGVNRFGQSITIEARQYLTSLREHYRRNYAVYTEQTLLHHMQQDANNNWGKERRKLIAKRTLMLLQPLYLNAAIGGNPLYQIPDIGGANPPGAQPFIFAGVPAHQAAIDSYLGFLQPIRELFTFAFNHMSALPAQAGLVAAVPAPVAGTYAAAEDELHNGVSWPMNWKYMAKGAGNHAFLPLFYWLARYERLNRNPAPPPGANWADDSMSPVLLCPMRNDQGLQFHRFDVDYRGGAPIVVPPAARLILTQGHTSNHRNQLMEQWFNLNRCRQLRTDPWGEWMYRNQGQDHNVSRFTFSTDGEQVHLHFLVTGCAANVRRRIPTHAQINNLEPRPNYNTHYHDEFRVVRSPDISRGGLTSLSRRPIITRDRALMTPLGARRVIGVDLGQKNCITAVYADTSQAPNAPQPNAANLKINMKAACRRVRGRHYREKNKSAWFERKCKEMRNAQQEEHDNQMAAFVAAAMGAVALPAPPWRYSLIEMIDLLRGRVAALHGNTVRSALNYFHLYYSLIDEMRRLHNGRLYQRCRLTRSIHQQSTDALVANYIIDPTYVNGNGVSTVSLMLSTNMLQGNRATRRQPLQALFPVVPPPRQDLPIIAVGNANYKFQRGHGPVPTKRLITQLASRTETVMMPEQRTGIYCPQGINGYDNMMGAALNIPVPMHNARIALQQFERTAHRGRDYKFNYDWCITHQRKKRMRRSNCPDQAVPAGPPVLPPGAPPPPFRNASWQQGAPPAAPNGFRPPHAPFLDGFGAPVHLIGGHRR
ncbi:hypothetical protein HKX48_006158 [Thoreauomyces humboldtii]|nr:hypothetical protein HKX48_006158 [Thoreauomyces humboldtii]